MKYYEEEFTINALKDYTFRFVKLSPIDILSISNDVIGSKEDDKLYKRFLTNAIESTQVKVNEKWLPVKEMNSETYYPAIIESKPKALLEITNRFFKTVIEPTFIESNESQK